MLETALSPFAKQHSCAEGDEVRLNQIHALMDMVQRKGIEGPPEFVLANLYWALYLGILGFWSTDKSNNQEDTLVLMDHAIRLFVQSIENGQKKEEENHGN